MRFGSCFAGIGGFDLGLEAAGMVPVWQIELGEYGRAILARHWPEVARYAAIEEVPKLDPVDIICGGFPCQDISVAGKQDGIFGDKSRLWFEMLRVVQEVRPRWVLVENSPALRTRGADEVLSGLEGLGYACWPLVVGAYAVGAPHRRERVWIVGYAGSERRPASEIREVRTGGRSAEFASDLADAGITGCEGIGLERVFNSIGSPLGSNTNGRHRSVEYPSSSGLEGPRKRLPRRWPTGPVEPQHSWEPPRAVEFPVGRGVNGFSRRLAERRRQRELEALGAAVVPQVAEAIGRAIMRVDRELNQSLAGDLEWL
jgi:site-specific DNA-cytosine methylase